MLLHRFVFLFFLSRNWGTDTQAIVCVSVPVVSICWPSQSETPGRTLTPIGLVELKHEAIIASYFPALNRGGNFLPANLAEEP